MVIIKTPEQVAGIKKSCQALALVMQELIQAVRPGATTKELNALVERRIEELGGKPAFKGYQAVPGGTPFPSALCASLNETVVHGPATSEEPLKEGDILGLDLGIELNGFFSDMAVTQAVGKIDSKTQALLDVTRTSLENGIAVMKPGATIRDISQAIEDTIRPHGYGIIRDFVGHGVGIEVHEDPRIPNYVSKQMKQDLDIVLKEGMVLAIEPMVTAGREEVSIIDDGWSVVADDGSLTAHFEHSIAITADGHDILTQL